LFWQTAVLGDRADTMIALTLVGISWPFTDWPDRAHPVSAKECTDSHLMRLAP
jgi:hypothetical protein